MDIYEIRIKLALISLKRFFLKIKIKDDKNKSVLIGTLKFIETWKKNPYMNLFINILQKGHSYTGINENIMYISIG